MNLKDIQLDPVLPIWTIVLLTVLSGVMIGLSLRRCSQTRSRRAIVFAIRLAAVLLLAALLLQPELLHVRDEQTAPTLAILVDRSISMTNSPAEDPMTRVEMLNEFIGSHSFRRGLDRYQVKWYEFGEDVTEAVDPRDRQTDFTGPRTHLVKAINEIVQQNRSVNLAGIVVLSDGLDQSIQPLAAEALRVPLFIPELERRLPPRQKARLPDFSIAGLDHPKLLVVNWKGEVQLSVERDIAETRLACPVKLLRGNTVIRSATLLFEQGETIKPITFEIQPPTIGRISYAVELQPEQDREKENNRRIFAIDVSDPKNRVLYLEGTPRWAFKYLKRAIISEKSYQLSAYVQSAPGMFLNFSEGAESAAVTDMPQFSDESTLRFRAIVLGELKASALSDEQQDALLTYVERGGGLLFLAGAQAYGAEGWPSSEPMRRLLPFENETGAAMEDGRFSLIAPAEGKNHPILKGMDVELGVPDVLSLWRPVKKSASATVLFEAPDGSPVILVSRYGQGKIVALLTDSLWRWQLSAARDEHDRSPYENLVIQMLYWLSPQKKEVDESSSLEVVTAGAEAEVRQRVSVGAFAAEGAGQRRLRCTVKMPDSRTVTYDMSAAKLGANVGLTKAVAGWICEFEPHMAGLYEITVEETNTGETAETSIVVTQPQVERTGKEINRRYLKRLANQTGGAFYKIRQHEDLVYDIPFKPERNQVVSQSSIWNRWPILLLLIAIFTIEWYLRSRFDMV